MLLRESDMRNQNGETDRRKFNGRPHFKGPYTIGPSYYGIGVPITRKLQSLLLTSSGKSEIGRKTMEQPRTMLFGIAHHAAEQLAVMLVGTIYQKNNLYHPERL